MMKRTLIRCVMLFFVGIAAIHAGATEPWNGEPGVVHLASPAPGGRYDGFMVHRDDGSVIMFGAKEARLSISAGDTWGEPFKLRTADDKEISHNCRAALKLQSDKIGLVTGRQGEHYFQTSADGGRTFGGPTPITAQGVRKPHYRSQITQLKSGRIIIPFYEFCGRRNSEQTWTRAPWSWSAMCYSYVVYSDDEGQTWHQSEDDVVIVPAYWAPGHTETFAAFEEPTVVELKDGRLMMLGRNRMGRLFESFSMDQGVHWSIAEPTELAASYAPAELRRIPSTGDLLICWNQISKQEIVDGLNRHRLSVAVSVDEGKTWGNYKNLYSLDDYNYVRPDPPQIIVPGEKWVEIIRKNGGPLEVLGRGAIGRENVYMLPKDRSRYHREPASGRTCYPLMCITDEEVHVVYSMSQPMPSFRALDSFPIKWLYEPIVPEGPYAELVIDGKKVEDADISAEDGTLFGWGDVLGQALDLEMKRTRVPVRTFLKNYGATVPDDGWQPGEGPKGTVYASRLKITDRD